jgi:hypothetical protein
MDEYRELVESYRQEARKCAEKNLCHGYVADDKSLAITNNPNEPITNKLSMHKTKQTVMQL